MASEHFNGAIEIEPDWAPPYAGLAEVEAYRNQMSFIPPTVAIPKIYENLNNALCRMFYAHLLNILHRSEEAIQHADLALKLDPSRAFIVGLYAALMKH